jgi:trehalose 6-phosphate phosphatase
MALLWPIVQTIGELQRQNKLRQTPQFSREEQRVPAMMYRSRRPHLFDNWDEVSRRVQTADHIQLFLDFDGTLVNFHVSPDKVRLTANARRALGRLVRHRSLQVTIVSGRRRATLSRHVRVPGVKLLGLYGWENRAGRHLPRGTARSLDLVRTELAELPHKLPGIHLEDKGISVAVHFRGATSHVRHRACNYIRCSLARFQSQLRVLRGNDIWEVVPKQVSGKNIAIRKAIKDTGKASLRIYLGDDLTDEPAFALLSNGITVLVGPGRQTKAHFALRGPEEVCQFLNRLEVELP